MKKLIASFLLIFIVNCGGRTVPVTETGYLLVDYVTNHGIRVTVGEINTPSQKSVEFWTDETLVHWIYRFPQLGTCIRNRTKEVRAIFWDRDWIYHAQYGKVAGKQQNNRIDISYSTEPNDPKDKVRGVFIHELSHVIVRYCMDIPGTEKSHEFFEKYGLCGVTVWC